jgi:hypothetical protein
MSRDADSERKILPALDAYILFPCRPPGNCGKTRDAILYDLCVMDNESNGHFLYNASLYPHKIKKKIHGCPLRVSAFKYPSVMMGMKTNKDGTIEYEEGNEVKLLHELVKRTNMSILHRPSLPDNGTGEKVWGTDTQMSPWMILVQMPPHKRDGVFGTPLRRFSKVVCPLCQTLPPKDEHHQSFYSIPLVGVLGRLCYSFFVHVDRR